MTDGWDASAEAWIASMGEAGDFSRQHVLDAPMMERLTKAAPGALLDLGCGEGRFCRIIAPNVDHVAGIDPTEALISHAKAKGSADYHVARREPAV